MQIFARVRSLLSGLPTDKGVAGQQYPVTTDDYGNLRTAAQSPGLCAWQRTITTSPTRLVPDWATGTAYVVGEVVLNGGALYRCITAGTSASSGSGPTADDDDITDNTAHWQRIRGFAQGVLITNPDASSDVYIGAGDTITTSKGSSALMFRQAKAYPIVDPSSLYAVAGSSVVITIEAAL